ncbi:MAG TPA: hypothetical protein VFE63_19980 [Roseiarcus sp.]|nr:hypothetical protein [Roseiarcus sp.]
MTDIRVARRALIARVLEGDGEAARSDRRAAYEDAGLTGALAALVGKVAMRSAEIDDADFAAVRAAGLSEDQVFEIVVCAAVGQAARQHDAALAALDAATAAS